MGTFSNIWPTKPGHWSQCAECDAEVEQGFIRDHVCLPKPALPSPTPAHQIMEFLTKERGELRSAARALVKSIMIAVTNGRTGPFYWVGEAELNEVKRLLGDDSSKPALKPVEPAPDGHEE